MIKDFSLVQRQLSKDGHNRDQDFSQFKNLKEISSKPKILWEISHEGIQAKAGKQLAKDSVENIQAGVIN